MMTCSCIAVIKILKHFADSSKWKRQNEKMHIENVKQEQGLKDLIENIQQEELAEVFKSLLKMYTQWIFNVCPCIPQLWPM